MSDADTPYVLKDEADITERLTKQAELARAHGYLTAALTSDNAAMHIKVLRHQLSEMTKDRDSWRRQCEMYAHAWLRSIGGLLFRKRHHIDALVLTTEAIYKAVTESERALAQYHQGGLTIAEMVAKVETIYGVIWKR